MNTTHITGKLILAGDSEYVDDVRADPPSPMARVVIVMPRDRLGSVVTLPMYEEVTVVRTGDLAELRLKSQESAIEIARLNAEIERWRQSNIRLRDGMEHQALRANTAEADVAALELCELVAFDGQERTVTLQFDLMPLSAIGAKWVAKEAKS
jgi:hypothetical protein